MGPAAATPPAATVSAASAWGGVVHGYAAQAKEDDKNAVPADNNEVAQAAHELGLDAVPFRELKGESAEAAAAAA